MGDPITPVTHQICQCCELASIRIRQDKIDDPTFHPHGWKLIDGEWLCWSCRPHPPTVTIVTPTFLQQQRSARYLEYRQHNLRAR